jgi:hypothetical protein
MTSNRKATSTGASEQIAHAFRGATRGDEIQLSQTGRSALRGLHLEAGRGIEGGDPPNRFGILDEDRFARASFRPRRYVIRVRTSVTIGLRNSGILLEL